MSRWEMDVSFPETDKLIRLSQLFECSIDYLLNQKILQNERPGAELSAREGYSFILAYAMSQAHTCVHLANARGSIPRSSAAGYLIRECGYFFLATSVEGRPRLRPFGMIYEKDEVLCIVTDKRKQVYSDLQKNARVELASYNPATHKWIRIGAVAEAESSEQRKEELMDVYSNLRRAYQGEEEKYLAIFRLEIEHMSIR